MLDPLTAWPSLEPKSGSLGSEKVPEGPHRCVFSPRAAGATAWLACAREQRSRNRAIRPCSGWRDAKATSKARLRSLARCSR